MRFFRQYLSPRQIIFVIGEGVLMFFAVSLASFLLLGRDVGYLPMMKVIWLKMVIIAAVTQLSLYFNDLYEFKLNERTIDIAARLMQAIGVTSISLAIVYLIWPDLIIGRWIFFASLLFLIALLISWRLLYAMVIRRKLFTEKTLMVGNGELAGDILREVSDTQDLSYDIRAIVGAGGSIAPGGGNCGRNMQENFDHLCDLAQEEKVDSIIVALDEKRGVFPYKQLLDCKVHGINIIDGESFYERITGKLIVERINPSWLIFSDGFQKSRLIRFNKRIVDLVASAVLLVLFSPILLITALAIKLESPGPLLFPRKGWESMGMFLRYTNFGP